MPVAAGLYYAAYHEEDGRFPVVLVHGAGGSHLSWPPEIRRLPGYRLFAPDLPGHGKSSGHGQQSIPTYARSVMEWFEALDLNQAVFVGHSMGSAIALSLALEVPEYILGLVLIGSGARLRVHPDFLHNSSSEMTFQNAVDQVVQYSFSSQASPRLLELVGSRMAETRASVLHGDFLACDSFDEVERVELIQQPVLVICGADDQMTPVRHAQFLANKIPTARLETIPNAGHMVQLEQPLAVAKLVKTFLDEIPTMV